MLAMAGCSLLPELSVGIGASTVRPDDGAIDTDNGVFNADAYVALEALTMLEVEVSLGMREYTVTDGTTGEPVDMTNMPLAAVAKLKLGPAHIGLGLVYNVTEADDTTTVSESDYESYRLVAGVRTPWLMKLRVAADIMYDITDAELEGLSGGDSADLGVTQFRISVGYNF